MSSILVSFCLNSNFILGQDAYLVQCDQYQTGYFEFEDHQYKNTIIYRDSTAQIEYNLETEEYVFVKLKWVDSCSYSFVYVSTNIRSLKKFIGTGMKVEIINPDKYGYDYKAYSPNSEETFSGRIFSMTRTLPEDQKQKLLARFEKEKLRLTK